MFGGVWLFALSETPRVTLYTPRLRPAGEEASQPGRAVLAAVPPQHDRFWALWRKVRLGNILLAHEYSTVAGCLACMEKFVVGVSHPMFGMLAWRMASFRAEIRKCATQGRALARRRLQRLKKIVPGAPPKL